MQRRFPQDEDGNYDPSNGTYLEEKTLLNVKFQKKMRADFGVEMKLDERRCEHGVRLMPFDYTEKKVISKMEADKIILTKIARVKGLNRDNRKWVKDQHVIGVFYFNDSVHRIEGVGKVAKRLLNENENGIRYVGDLMGVDKKSIKSIAKGTKGLAVTSLQSYIANCKNISPEDTPTVIHYIDQVNLYAARYGTEKDEWGEERWMTMIKKSTAFPGIVCITTLLKHMIMATKKCYANTEQENTFMIYHVALTQLTHNKTVEWMRTTKIPGEDTMVYKQWIKPENGLNDMFGKKWKG